MATPVLNSLGTAGIKSTFEITYDSFSDHYMHSVMLTILPFTLIWVSQFFNLVFSPAVLTWIFAVSTFTLLEVFAAPILALA